MHMHQHQWQWQEHSGCARAVYTVNVLEGKAQIVASEMVRENPPRPSGWMVGTGIMMMMVTQAECN